MPELPTETPPEANRPSRARLVVIYGLLFAATVGLFLLVRGYGETLTAPLGGEGSGVTRSTDLKSNVLFHVLLALVTVIALGRVLGRLFAYVGQPPVIGEVVAGILLGPSLLGWIAPAAAAFILPSSAAPFLGVIAQIGVTLYMFLVGLELNAGLLRQRGQATAAIAHASIALPFLMGAALALFLYPRLSSRDVPFTSFALFLGVAMAITAFPVLARILTDRGISRTELGVTALACAAIDDATAWCLLAFVVGMAQAEVGTALLMIVLTLLYIAFMFLAVRPLAGRLAARYDQEHLPQGVVALVFIALLLSALATELIGLHAIFGAFLLGAVIPHDGAIARAFTHKLEEFVIIVLLPAFFAFTGLRTEIGLVSGLEQWLLCGLIILVATIGKFGGTLAAARWTGLDWRTSAALGILMNTRGLMELIVLNIGLDMGVISPTLFAMMVLMALATTIATTPLLQRLLRAGPDAIASPRPEAIKNQKSKIKN